MEIRIIELLGHFLEHKSGQKNDEFFDKKVIKIWQVFWSFFFELFWCIF